MSFYILLFYYFRAIGKKNDDGTDLRNDLHKPIVKTNITRPVDKTESENEVEGRQLRSRGEKQRQRTRSNDKKMQ